MVAVLASGRARSFAATAVAAQRRHTPRVHDREGRAVGRIGEHDRSLDGRQPPLAGVIREVGIGLGSEVAALADQTRGLDVKTATGSVHAQDAGSDGVPVGVQSECVLHGVDALR